VSVAHDCHESSLNLKVYADRRGNTRLRNLLRLYIPKCLEDDTRVDSLGAIRHTDIVHVICPLPNVEHLA
jgi:hypothetical protein